MKRKQNEALTVALKLITKKDRTEAELRERLQRKGFPEKDINEAIQYLRQKGFIDDSKFIQKAKEIAEKKFLGVMGLKDYLMKRGIDKELIQQIPEIDEFSIAQKLIEKKKPFLRDIQSDKKKVKIAGFLLRRGFSWDTINKCLNEKFLEDIESPQNEISREV